MSNLMYLLKIALLTIVVMVVMQLHIGKKTIENHAENFIRKSSLMEPAREAAQGGLIFLKEAYRGTIHTMDSFLNKQFRSENSPGRRKIFELKRSLAFHKDREEKIRKKNLEEERQQSSYEEDEDVGEE